MSPGGVISRAFSCVMPSTLAGVHVNGMTEWSWYGRVLGKEPQVICCHAQVGGEVGRGGRWQSALECRGLSPSGVRQNPTNSKNNTFLPIKCVVMKGHSVKYLCEVLVVDGKR